MAAALCVCDDVFMSTGFCSSQVHMGSLGRETAGSPILVTENVTSATTHVTKVENVHGLKCHVYLLLGYFIPTNCSFTLLPGNRFTEAFRNTQCTDSVQYSTVTGSNVWPWPYIWRWQMKTCTEKTFLSCLRLHVLGSVFFTLTLVFVCKIKIIISLKLKDSNLLYLGNTDKEVCGSSLNEKLLCVADGERRVFRDEDREEDYNNRRRWCRPRTGELRCIKEMWVKIWSVQLDDGYL